LAHLNQLATQASILIVCLIAGLYDIDAFHTMTAALRSEPTTGHRARPKLPMMKIDEDTYGLQYRFECFINKIKHENALMGGATVQRPSGMRTPIHASRTCW
jgi:hypothetical protein